MVHYRKFRNADPPGLVAVWNEVFAGRGAVRLVNSTPLERCIFAKTYFDPAGLFIAEEDGAVLGFAHAGFGVGGNAALSNKDGVVCLIGVRPAHRRRGLGSQLLQACEAYLRERGAEAIFAGPHHPRDPFYLGLYGGSELPGFLVKLDDVQPFLARHRYQVCQEIQVFQRRVPDPVKIIDPRLAAHRQNFELRVGVPRAMNSWWQECVLSSVEPLEFYLAEKKTAQRVARALAWEMDGFGAPCQVPMVGIVGLEVSEARRRVGLGKFFLSQLLRSLQEQYFALAEIQVDQTNTSAAAFCRGMGFSQVDVGRVYRKDV